MEVAPMFYVNARAIIEREVKGEREIVIQRRMKPDAPGKLELPGGRIEPFESLLDALVREVKEETGLDVVTIEGQETRVVTTGINPDFVVECVRPFAAYQTVRGPVDSLGYYFRCAASGELLEAGDDTSEVRWMAVDELQALFAQDPLAFADVDRAGILYYLNSGKGRST